MRARARHFAAPAGFAFLATLLVGWDGMLTVAWTDHEREAEPAFDALRAGHLGGFLGHLPAYGGSLILRSPFALFPSLWHGGALAVYRSTSAPCLLAAMALGLIVWNELARRGRTGAGWLALALFVANPITLRALEIGHPDEILEAALCVAAVLAAIRDRPWLAGVLLGLALANKPTAVFAVPPVAFALRRGWVRTGVTAAVVAGTVLAPMLLFSSSGVASARVVATGTDVGFTPQQLWWFFGAHGRVVGVEGLVPGARVPPAWLPPIGHLVVVAGGFAASGLWAWLRRFRKEASTPAGSSYEPLLLLAFAMLVRCVLDPWDIIYYPLPFLFALTAWEALQRPRLPLASLVTTAGLWVSWNLIGQAVAPDMASIAFLGWAVPVAGLLAWRLYAPTSFSRRLAPLARGVEARLPTLAPAFSSR